MIYIATTTINAPTKALKLFAKNKNCKLIVALDKKSKPFDLKNSIILTTSYQEKKWPKLSKLVGWNCIQRRNFAILEAYKRGAETIALIDDDNIPYDNWGDEVLVGQEVEIDVYEHKDFIVFDPISPTNHNDLWHRGYPIEMVPEKNNIEYKGKGLRKVLIQADFWDGDPDIDALCRLSKMPVCKFDEFKPFGSPDIAPFNSQNTFLAREVLPYYAVLPHAGRMDDIWGAYIVQHYFPRSVVYNKATVYQDRNEQDLITNMENEIIGYRNTLNLIQDLSNYYNYLPEASQKFWDVYRKQFN